MPVFLKFDISLKNPSGKFLFSAPHLHTIKPNLLTTINGQTGSKLN
jgi:hypothetical protein